MCGKALLEGGAVEMNERLIGRWSEWFACEAEEEDDWDGVVRVGRLKTMVVGVTMANAASGREW